MSIRDQSISFFVEPKIWVIGLLEFWLTLLLLINLINFSNYYRYINYYIYWAITHKKTQVQAFNNRNEVLVNDFLKQNNLEFIPRN